jgi:hypothetical protein
VVKDSRSQGSGTLSFYGDDASGLFPGAPLRPRQAGDRRFVGELAYAMVIYQGSVKDLQGRPAADHGKYVEAPKAQANAKGRLSPARAEEKAPAWSLSVTKSTSVGSKTYCPARVRVGRLVRAIPRWP